MTPWTYNDWQTNGGGGWGSGRWTRGQTGGQQHWNGSQPHRPKGGQWWSCKDSNCVAAMKAGGRQPCVNKPSALECDVCGTHWNAEQQVRDLQLLAIKTRLKAAKAKATEAAAEANGGVLCEDEMECEAAATPAAWLTDEFVSVARLLLLPPEMSDDWNATDTLDRFLPKKLKGDPSKLEAALQDQLALLV